MTKHLPIILLLVGLHLQDCLAEAHPVIISAQAAQGRRPLTVTDMLETTRPMIGLGIRHGIKSIPPDAVVKSPDGNRYVIMLIKGDVSANGVWMELWSGQLSALSVATPRRLVRLFTSALGPPNGLGVGPVDLVLPQANPPRWTDGRSVAFRWEDVSGIAQVYRIDVETAHIEQLTHSETAVTEFYFSPTGDLLFDVCAPRLLQKAEAMVQNGFTVDVSDMVSLLYGNVDGYSSFDLLWNRIHLILRRESTKPAVLKMSGADVDSTPYYVHPIFSPDGNLAIVDGPIGDIPDTWNSISDDYVGPKIAAWRRGSVESKKLIRQLQILNLKTNESTALWDAPMSVLKPPHIAWSPSSAEIVIASTFLPNVKVGNDGLSVAVLNLRTTGYEVIKLPDDIVATDIRDVSWPDSRSVRMLLADGRALNYRRTGGWRLDGIDLPSSVSEDSLKVLVRFREDINTPPRLFGMDPVTGEERMLLDINPKLTSEVTLGKVTALTWMDASEREWQGRLYFPAQYIEGRKFPLLIQTHGVDADNIFSVYGKGGSASIPLGPGLIAYAAQAVANRGIGVLQIGDNFAPGIFGTDKEPEMYMRAYEAAIELLRSRGLVDVDRVGIMGYSRSGWHVEYALSHSEFPYAAAMVADNIDGGYLQASLFSWSSELTESLNGSLPFGEGFAKWHERSPPFNAQHVHTPLQIQVSTGGLPGLLSGWEMFSRLRKLGKPVEYYVIPDIKHGSHSAQNPRQTRASIQRAVDWWDFWLNGRENNSLGNSAQYESWRLMRTRQTKHGVGVSSLDGKNRVSETAQVERELR